MEFSPKFKRYFAIVTFALALVHFVLETAYTIVVGQHFLGYLPDCIADILLVAGAYLLIKNEKTQAYYAARGALPSVFIIAPGRGGSKISWPAR